MDKRYRQEATIDGPFQGCVSLPAAGTHICVSIMFFWIWCEMKK